MKASWTIGNCECRFDKNTISGDLYFKGEKVATTNNRAKFSTLYDKHPNIFHQPDLKALRSALKSAVEFYEEYYGFQMEVL